MHPSRVVNELLRDVVRAVIERDEAFVALPEMQ